MNKKQAMVTGFLLCLMGVMVFMQQFFEDKIQNGALVSNNIEDMQSYSALDGNIVYKLPDNWRSEISGTSDYIAYDNNFFSEEMGIVGYVQILNTKTNVDELIEIDKKTFNSEKVDNMRVLDEKIGTTKVKKLRYNEHTNTGKQYDTRNYYFELGENLRLKIVFSASMDKYRDSYESVYRLILESFKWNKQ